jgi:hypothetical protein
MVTVTPLERRIAVFSAGMPAAAIASNCPPMLRGPFVGQPPS